MTQENLIYGATIDQMDRLAQLLNTLSATGDMLAIAGDPPMDDATLPTLGDAVFTAALAAREIVHEIGEQRLVAPKAPLKGGVDKPDTSGSSKNKSSQRRPG